MTRVVHVNKEPFDVYIGRACRGYKASKWANPYRIGKDGTREEVLEKYRQDTLANDELMMALLELRDKVLGCWCKPERCHGDILREMLEAVLARERAKWHAMAERKDF